MYCFSDSDRCYVCGQSDCPVETCWGALTRDGKEKPSWRQQKKEGMAPTGKAYDPKKQYVVNRDRVGRPHRVLSDEEQADISRLSGQGMSINAIAKEQKASMTGMG